MSISCKAIEILIFKRISRLIIQKTSHEFSCSHVETKINVAARNNDRQMIQKNNTVMQSKLHLLIYLLNVQQIER